MIGDGEIGKSEAKGDHRRMDLSSLAEAREYGGPTGAHAMALTPARCARSVRRCLRGTPGVGSEGTEYMFIVLSADAVASNVISGENLREVIPRAWARGMVVSGMKFKDFEDFAGVGESDRGLGSSIEDA